MVWRNKKAPLASIAVSVLLVFNCLGGTGIALATDAGDEAQAVAASGQDDAAGREQADDATGGPAGERQADAEPEAPGEESAVGTAPPKEEDAAGNGASEAEASAAPKPPATERQRESKQLLGIHDALEKAKKASLLKAPAPQAVQNDVITKVEAQTYDGSGPQESTGPWDIFRLYAEFALPNGTVNAGDTTTITLPDKLKFNQTASFQIKDGAGNVVANAVFDGNAKTITLTYTEFVENNSDITGSFYFYVQIDRNNVDEAEYIPVEIDVSGKTVIGNTLNFRGIGTPEGTYLAKSGWQEPTISDRALRYQLSVNTKGEAINDVTITDKIASAGFTVLRDSIIILKGTWAAVHGEWSLQNQSNVTSAYEVTWNKDGSFTLNLGDLAAADGFIIRYTAEASYDLVDGEIVKNDAVIRGTNIDTRTVSANSRYYVAGGTAEGYVFTVRIIKEDRDGNALAGAVFNVIRDANDQVVGTVTTDAEGRAEVGDLLKDAYRIEEAQAPDGYVRLEEPVLVNVGDFNGEKVAVKTIANERDATTAVSGSKTWDDNGDQDGTRPDSITVRLLADGAEVDSRTVTGAGGWSWSFEGLPRFANGAEIAYSITEDAVPGYVAEYDGYDVTNRHAPGKTGLSVSKAWDDNGDQDGIRPSSVTVKLLADGVDTGKSVVLGKANNWTGSFTDLDEYANGKKISYSVAEQDVEGYASSVSGDASRGFTVTNAHTPGNPPPSPKDPTPGKSSTTPNKSAATPGKSSLPKTGDGPAGLALVLIAVSAAGLVAFATTRKDS